MTGSAKLFVMVFLAVGVLTHAYSAWASQKSEMLGSPVEMKGGKTPTKPRTRGDATKTSSSMPASPDPAKFSKVMDPKDRLQPWRLVRHLQHVQDAIAQGKQGSLNAYRKYLVQYSQLMLDRDTDTWAYKRNIDAAAIYVLIGGNPEVGIKAIETSILADAVKYPLKAAIAYAQRDFVAAHKMMLDIDNKLLSLSAAAQFALARSMVTSSTDLKAAAAHLNEARRLAPGTLIEEAALRRSLRIAGGDRNQEQFDFIASTYFRRFGNSLYMGDYLRNYAYGLVRMSTENQDKNLADLQQTIKTLKKNQQFAVASYAARSAVVSGRMSIAEWASNWVLQRAEPGGILHTRMKLYSAASGIVQLGRLEESAELLKEIDQSILDKNDQKLLHAVISLADKIKSDPMDLASLKMEMRIQQQTFPGDEPIIPKSLQKLDDVVRNNKTIMQAELLFSKLEELFPEGSP